MDRRSGIGLEVFAETEDEVVDGAGAGVDVVAPDLFEDVLAGNDLAGAGGEEAQEHRLAFGDGALLAGTRDDAVGSEVDAATRAEGTDGGLGRGRSIRQGEQPPHAQQQLLEFKRLAEVIVGPCPQALHAVRPGIAGGQEQDGRAVAFEAQRGADREAVEPRHHDVEHRAVDPAVAHRFEGFGAVGRLDDVPALEFEVEAQHAAQRGVVLGQEDVRFRGGGQIVHGGSTFGQNYAGHAGGNRAAVATEYRRRAGN